MIDRMLRCFFFLIVIIAMSVGCATTEPSAPRSVRVMTYNIHHGEGMDGELDLERIAAVITAAAPDLVALQEVDDRTVRTGGVDQAARLGELTGMHAVFGEAMPYDGGSYGEAVLSRLPIEATRVHPLSASPDHEPRCAIEVEVRVDNRLIRFVGTHLDHTRDPADRIAQATRLADLFTTGGPPVILVGDLNDTREGGSIDAILSGWTDSGAAADSPTIPSTGPERRIDYVLLRPVDGWRIAAVEVIDEPIASDHCPVLVELAPDQPGSGP